MAEDVVEFHFLLTLTQVPSLPVIWTRAFSSRTGYFGSVASRVRRRSSALLKFLGGDEGGEHDVVDRDQFFR